VYEQTKWHDDGTRLR